METAGRAPVWYFYEGPGTWPDEQQCRRGWIALWFFGSWVDAFWAALGAVPLETLVGPVAASLPIVLVAAVVGAWPYKE